MADEEQVPLDPRAFDFDYVRAEWQTFEMEFRQHRNPLETIVRGHLYVQAALLGFVEAALVRPDAINLANIRFPLLVQLSVAVGIIEPEDAAGFLKLNDFRNKFAHHVDADISLQDAIDFYHSLSPRFRPGTFMEKHKPFDQGHRHALILRSIKSLYFGTKTDARNFLLFGEASR